MNFLNFFHFLAPGVNSVNVHPQTINNNVQYQLTKWICWTCSNEYWKRWLSRIQWLILLILLGSLMDDTWERRGLTADLLWLEFDFYLHNRLRNRTFQYFNLAWWFNDTVFTFAFNIVPVSIDYAFLSLSIMLYIIKPLHIKVWKERKHLVDLNIERQKFFKNHLKFI